MIGFKMIAATEKKTSRAYSAPKLIIYGDMTALTKNNKGSVSEAIGGNTGSFQKA